MAITLTHLFPTPALLALPTVGIDFSDATMRFVALDESLHGILPSSFAEMPIPEGALFGGKIVDQKKFIDFLSEVKRKHNLKYVRVAIPESQTYSFTVPLDTAAVEDLRGAIELILEDNIPLKATEAIFGYQILSDNDHTIIAQVVAMSDAVSRSYYDSFITADLVPVSFELDSQAIARAVIVPGDKSSSMIVDFGAHRTSIIIVTAGTAVFTSTIDFGGKNLLDTLAKELNISVDEAQALKREYGLSAMGEHRNIFSVMVGGISTLKDEINRAYIYWHEKKDQFGSFPDIKKIYLCGGHSNLRGLSDYLSVTLKLDVLQANPWVNCVSFDEAIPSLPYELSMSYVTTIGLALADYHYD